MFTQWPADIAAPVGRPATGTSTLAKLASKYYPTAAANSAQESAERTTGGNGILGLVGKLFHSGLGSLERVGTAALLKAEQEAIQKFGVAEQQQQAHHAAESAESAGRAAFSLQSAGLGNPLIIAGLVALGVWLIAR